MPGSSRTNSGSPRPTTPSFSRSRESRGATEGEEFCGERVVGEGGAVVAIEPRDDRISAEASATWGAETEPETAEDGEYLGEVIAIDTEGDLLDVQTFEENDPQGRFLRFAYDDGDTFQVNENEDVTVEEFECAVEATLEEDADRLVGVDYASEGESTFDLLTDADVDACFESE
ncbi:MAG: hypothetical protein ACRDUY_13615 [Nitriliruptorales bacterium]